MFPATLTGKPLEPGTLRILGLLFVLSCMEYMKLIVSNHLCIVKFFIHYQDILHTHSVLNPIYA